MYKVLASLLCLLQLGNTFRISSKPSLITKLSMNLGERNVVPTSIGRKEMVDYSKYVLPLGAALIATLGPVLQKVQAAEAPVAEAPKEPEKVPLGPPPTDFGLSLKDYYADCTKIVNHMRYAVQMEKGDSNIATIAQKTKDEMLEFVSFYRRYNGISGKQSFSLLYTSINVLSGHYTSYGVKFPVPEKRRKRLMQEFNDIEKNIRKKR